MTVPSVKPLISPDLDPAQADPHLWLEEVTGERALAWVHQRNARAEERIQDEAFDPLRTELREILDASDRIPGVTKRGEHLYNFWTDAEHPQGLWRRTTEDSYRSATPDWEVLLDLDALSAEEGVTWVWHGAEVLRPRGAGGQSPPADTAGQPATNPWRHTLISLSPGGSDADVTREFDLVTRSFIPESEGGFHRPQGKGGLSWIDADTVYLTHDDGADAVTSSGYPRVARRWHRGTPLADAQAVLSVETDHMTAVAGFDSTPGFERHFGVRLLGFYDRETYLIDPSAQDAMTLIEVPTDVSVGFHRDLIVLRPRTDFTHHGVAYRGGSLIVGDAEQFIAGEPELRVLFEPTESAALLGVTVTRETILVTIMEDVIHRVEAHWREAGRWRASAVFGELHGSLGVAAVDEEESEEVWVTSNDWVTPTSLYRGTLEGLRTGAPASLELIKQAPERFDSDGLASVQSFATSADGTRIPYFLIGRADAVQAVEAADPETVPGAAQIAGPEPHPTILYGYGGFQISQTPSYLGLAGKAWLEAGGVFAVANIRGGGEYGPGWHHAALKENRHRAYEDFAAVARDLVRTGVTTVQKLACRGGSNGGLLTGNMLAKYPELFGAVVIQVPLLDMRRFAQLLAGASWRAEYGDPETADWEFMQSFSPYHLVSEGVDYPPVLLTTSTRDDRVHPGHARKMTAALEELGADVTYWENTEGGHGGAANPAQQAMMNALIYRWLWQQLG
ncbi:prolyl oligopeptidase family serine peptidase [Nesterenkonia sp. DZ6]|uniref:prolyl oligopeptidase family serine peptidase n=1 Tax=Nesterenkonia sp. DZ6 TaxID=2901229 RepID=UPI001F4C76F9|nr:prolyl oligopeptidase family serine peptidase [Nesterenkonia sp. DZ6]MCH8559911.1 prolyl oligopeptidase family serine peptidase [Nesterenkonia sp. DZ6]